MPLSKYFRFCLWWGSFFNGGHFSTCQTRKKSTPVTFFLHMRHVFLRPGVISLRRKMTPRSIFDGGRYSSLHRSYVKCKRYDFDFIIYLLQRCCNIYYRLITMYSKGRITTLLVVWTLGMCEWVTGHPDKDTDDR